MDAVDEKSATALVSKRTKTKSEFETEHDLELRLLRAFGAFVSDSLVGSYLCVKRSSRITTLIGNTTEALVTKTGLVKLVGMLFAQFQRVAHPWLKVADEAMGKRVIDMFVSILLLANVHEGEGGEQRENATTSDLEAAKEQHLQSAVRLSYHERIQALLQGELPRVEALLREAKRRELEALALQRQLQLQQQKEQAARALAPPPVVMELKDFVPVDEVKRIKEANKEQLQEKSHEVVALREQLNALERERQRLEQDLTDVHSYQESERGRRFQEMEVWRMTGLGMYSNS